MPRLTNTYLGLFAVLVAGLVAAASPAARAFTIDNSSNTNSDGSAKYADPDDRYQSKSASKPGTSTFQFGSGTGTFSVGPQRSFDNDYSSGTDRMFTPLGRPGEH
jgi:hypothetical protein